MLNQNTLEALATAYTKYLCNIWKIYTNTVVANIAVLNEMVDANQ